MIPERFTDAKQCGQNKWQAKCPCHDDSTASLSITRADDGRWLLHCFAGCATADVIAAAGLEWSDLGGQAEQLRSTPAEYKYHDASGQHAYTVVRGDNKKFMQKRADGTWGMKGVQRLPYNLPEVLKADTVFIVEGEKDVETLRRAGLVGSCNSGGAGKWQADFKPHFEGKTVYVLPDNDDPGKAHARDVVEKLGHGTIIELPVGKKQDVTDWFATGKSKADLLELVENTARKTSVTTPAGRLLAAYVNRINTGDLPQLYKQYSALDRLEVGPELLTIIGAPPGVGKTALASQVMFDTLELNPGVRAVIANAEMSFDSLIRRELSRRTQIDSDRIRFGQLTTDELSSINETAAELMPKMQGVTMLDEPCLHNLLQLRNEEPGLVIVDYLQKFSPSDKDARQGVNEVVSGLRKLAQAGWAVLCLSATKRDSKGKHGAAELDMSSFRESGEVEYNADSAYVLQDQGELEEPYIRSVTLKHVKNRHGGKKDFDLRFHMPRMEFTTNNMHPDFADTESLPWEREPV